MAVMRTTSLLAVVATLAVGTSAPLAQERYDPARIGYPSAPVADDWAEPFGDDLPVFVSVVDGYAELDRAGRASRDIENVPLLSGDRLRTTRGRVELLFDDGSTVVLDEHTAIVVLSATDVELYAGRLRARWRPRDSRDALTVQTSAGRMITRGAGDYRVTLAASRTGDAEIEVAVSDGLAELENSQGRTLVRAGTRALTVAAYAPSLPYRFDVPRDDFERWADDVERDRYGYESARYLPTELRYYGGVFDRYGSWRHHTSYGWVWYPRVSVGWRPYDGGRWSFIVGFGYSWVGGSRWSWPTHHYGRWDCVGTTWFWVPARPPVHHRAVGFAVPRPSYNTTVNYYVRPGMAQRPGTAQRPGAAPRPTGGWPSSGAPQGVGPRQDRAIPRAGSAPDAGRPIAEPARPDRPTATRRAPDSWPSADTPVTRTRPAAEPRSNAPDRPAAGRAVPAPRVPPTPRADTPSRAETRRSSPPSSSARPSEPRRSAPAPERAAPPQRSAPTARSAPPQSSGSRTPSRAGGGSSSSSGQARRRGGG